jgi:phosphatidylserine/phosphatidylglycerophosphate/cardiolipin synthase-like enzyme
VVQHRILRPGSNCWKTASSDRIAFLVDGKRYFDALAAAMEQAERRIIIVGWDFDSRIRLQPDRRPAVTLGDFLRNLVDSKPTLSIYILIWRGSVYYGSNPEFPGLPAGEWFAGDWLKHERIHFLLDAHHPVSSSHHQKIITIDDSLAFVGGMDLTQGRWDTSGHAPVQRHRVEVGENHPPVHDVQMMVDGDAARIVCACALDRWRLATGEQLEPPATARTPWPEHVRPAVRRHPVAVARTLPAYGEQPEIREIEQLNADCLAAANDCIYLEIQYFATPGLAEILAEHLRRPEGPEVVIVVTCRSKGIIEHYVMAQTRDRLFAELRAADRFGRLRMFYPVSGPEPEGEIEIHSKLIIIDDRFLRVGSSNLNNRSLGVDTECDLALEAETASARRAIGRLRTRLVAEHLGVRPAILAAAYRAKRSLARTIDWLNRPPRGLIPFDADENPASRPLPRAKEILDPYRPLDLKYLWLSITETDWAAMDGTEAEMMARRSREPSP